MKATETALLTFLQVPKQLIIPIYQRTYSWTEKQCEQLWQDIIRVAKDDKIPSHFIGSIVYIEKGLFHITNIPQILVIDGQQRLTTISLLLAALRKTLDNQNTEITKKRINDYYLFNNVEEGEIRYKLILTQSDKITLLDILEEKSLRENYSKNIKDNFDFFEKKISKNSIDLKLLYRGIQKLVIVDIALDRNHDDPQLIFESLNSTGLKLSQADLIRNYILNKLEREKQENIYNDHWYPMEESFGHSEGSKDFDRFMRDYLTIKTGQIPNMRNVYSSFKEYVLKSKELIEDLVSDIHYFSKFFVKLAFEKERDKNLREIICNINALKVDVSYPFLLEVLVDYARLIISKEDVLEIFLMVESYVFRRAICDIPTNSLNKTFSNLASEIDKDSYVQSLKASFNLKDSYRRFPTDSEFKRQFVIKNVYNFQNKKYLFDKLENYNHKEYCNVDEYTIEHIMPQTITEEWKIELGSDWNRVHDKFLHTVGNLTLTGDNLKLSNKSFSEKKKMNGGFAQSPIFINSSLVNIESWNENEIKKRANDLAKKATSIWKFPQLESDILKKYHKEEEYDVTKSVNNIRHDAAVKAHETRRKNKLN